ncbi:hypothetical protein JCM10450v2_005428 [Rhodotorula kratochvilovae]
MPTYVCNERIPDSIDKGRPLSDAFVVVHDIVSSLAEKLPGHDGFLQAMHSVLTQLYRSFPPATVAQHELHPPSLPEIQRYLRSCFPLVAVRECYDECVCAWEETPPFGRGKILVNATLVNSLVMAERSDPSFTSSQVPGPHLNAVAHAFRLTILHKLAHVLAAAFFEGVPTPADFGTTSCKGDIGRELEARLFGCFVMVEGDKKFRVDLLDVHWLLEDPHGNRKLESISTFDLACYGSAASRAIIHNTAIPQLHGRPRPAPWYAKKRPYTLRLPHLCTPASPSTAPTSRSSSQSIPRASTDSVA